MTRRRATARPGTRRRRRPRSRPPRRRRGPGTDAHAVLSGRGACPPDSPAHESQAGLEPGGTVVQTSTTSSHDGSIAGSASTRTIRTREPPERRPSTTYTPSGDAAPTQPFVLSGEEPVGVPVEPAAVRVDDVELAVVGVDDLVEQDGTRGRRRRLVRRARPPPAVRLPAGHPRGYVEVVESSRGSPLGGRGWRRIVRTHAKSPPTGVTGSSVSRSGSETNMEAGARRGNSTIVGVTWDLASISARPIGSWR